MNNAAMYVRATEDNPLGMGEIPHHLAQVESSLADLSSVASMLIARLNPVLGIPAGIQGAKEGTASLVKAADSTEYGRVLSTIDDSIKAIHANLSESLDRLEV